MKDLNDPTNVDTVPAMLTPGEFVLNKEASQMFAPMIEQMNQQGLMQRQAENQGYNAGGFVDFLKKHEGWRDKAYQDSGGVWTIGYGRTTNADGSPIKSGQKTTKEDEDSWLDKRASAERSAIDSFAEKHGYDWNDQERNALASFRYNGGQGMIDQLTDNGTRTNDQIKDKFGQYNKADGEFVQGLQNRRNYEMELAGWGQTQPVEGTNVVDFPMGQQPGPAQQQPVPEPAVAPPSPADPPAYDGPTIPGLEDNFGGAVLQGLQGLMLGGGGGGATPPPPQGGNPMQYNDPRAWLNPQQPQMRNFGGWIKKLWEGAQNAPDQNAGYANMSQQDFVDEAQTFNNPGAQTQGYEVPPMMQPAMPGQAPMGMATPDTLTRPGMAEHVANRYNMDAPALPVPPQLQTLPPVPGSDEAILQGSSDAVEQVEDDSMRLQANSEIRQFAQTNYPEGHPIRARLMNDISHQKGVMPDMSRLGNVMDASPGTGANVPGVVGGQGVGGDYAPVPVPTQIPEPPSNPAEMISMIEALPEDQQNAAIDALPPEVQEQLFNAEEQQFKTNEALQQAQLQAAVTAPDAPGAEFQQARVNALTDQLDSLGVPKEAQGVGADVNIGGPDTAIPRPSGPGLSPNDVGAVPGLDTNAPTPQQVIDEGPDVFSAPDREPQPLSKDNLPATKAAVEEKIVATGEEPSQEEAAQAATAGAKASPERVEKAKGILQENFGGLFDKKELARAAVLFAGAMATGASPQKALAIAGQQYLGRIDAKEAQKVQSASALAKAQAKGAPVIDMTQSEEFVQDGRKVKGFKMTSTDPQTGVKTTRYVDKGGQPLSPDAHQNFDTVPGTAEYNTRVQKESKDYAKTFGELQERFGVQGEGKEKFYSTDLTPNKVGNNAAKWAISNNVPPEAMGQLIDNAYQQAISDSQGGAKARNIESYLNAQYIESEVGDPNLFGDAQADEVMSLVNAVKRRAGIKGDGISASTPVIQAASSAWNTLSPEEKQRWERTAKGTNKSPFMLWMEFDLQQ